MTYDKAIRDLLRRFPYLLHIPMAGAKSDREVYEVMIGTLWADRLIAMGCVK